MFLRIQESTGALKETHTLYRKAVEFFTKLKPPCQ